MIDSIIKRFIKIVNHIKYFWPIWLFFVCLGVAALYAANGSWDIAKRIIEISLIILLGLFILWKPLNIIYGLIGTTGSIQIFFFTILLINIVFAFIYFFAFFRYAGINYDINQPYVSYGMFTDLPDSIKTKEFKHEDKTYIYGISDSSSVYTISTETHQYQRISLGFVIQNTIITSLIQEPTDFFASASIYNNISNQEEKDIIGYCSSGQYPIHSDGIDSSKSATFNWILILQVFISWIFFGVFISILYSRFRYES